MPAAPPGARPRRPGAPLLIVALLALAPLAQAGVITGRVVDPDGQGVQGVDIDVETPSGGDVDIDSDGTSATGHFTTSVPDDADVAFGALAGWTLRKAKLKVLTDKAAPAPLQPTLELADPSGAPVPLDRLVSANAKGTRLTLGEVALDADGDHVLRAGGAEGSAGPAKVSVVLRPAKTKPAIVLEPQ